jgi:hypothetical protein
LRKTIESLPANGWRELALDRIKVLDCTNSDPALALCDPPYPPPEPPHEAADWRKRVDAAIVDDVAYGAALAKTLKDLLCPGGADAIYVVRGTGFQARLRHAGAAAKGLIDDLMTKDNRDCPVAALLADADRANLLRVKQDIGKAGK